MITLTKSQFLSGNQCEKKLYFDFFKPDIDIDIIEDQNNTLEKGTEIGKLAQSLFPEGIDVTNGISGNYSESIKKTKLLIESNHSTIYEACFAMPGGFIALDILHQHNNEIWGIEVKSSSSIKDYHITDASFQYYVMTKAGIKPDKMFIAYVNSDYKKNRELEPRKFFILEDITNHVIDNQSTISAKYLELINILNNNEAPIKDIGPHCNNPFSCKYEPYCWKKIPENNVFELYNARGKDWDLYHKGIYSIADIPEGTKLSHRQLLQVNGLKHGKSSIDTVNINNFLLSFKAPLYFFDFETINSIIPLLDGTSPFEQVPFQYSLHIADIEGALLKHKEFLAKLRSFNDPNFNDPRLELIMQLKEDFGDEGSIVAYNASFEIGVLKKLANQFQEHKSFLESLIERFVDLLIPFKNGWYYLPKMGPSASIKYVLPSIDPDFSYKDLSINNGGQASEIFLSMINGQIKDEPEIVRKNLLAYCERDTEGMLIIYRHLKLITEQ
jgi:hypothetical protein